MTTAEMEQMQTTEPELQDLAKQHLNILRQAVSKVGFRYQVTEDGQEAIDAGLVTESDPTWQYSDAYGASNGYQLTELGRQVAQSLGWTCQCSGCIEQRTQSKFGPSITIDGFCSNCTNSMRQYGKTEFRDQTCCGYHRRMMEEQGLAEPMLTANNEAVFDAQPKRHVRPNTYLEKPWVRPTPSNRPQLWRWRSRGNRWVATGSRPLNADETPPKLGHVVTVQKRNGQKSQHQVNQHVGMTRDGFPQLGVGPQIG